MAKPVHALVGRDSFLQLEKLSSLLAEMPADTQRVSLDGETAELADVLDELRSFAMFGGGKMVVVSNADDFVSRFRKQLEAYAKQPAEQSVLLLRLSSLPANQRLYKIIAQSGKIEPCDPPKDLVRWITQRGKDPHGLAVSLDAARMLADFIGSNLGRIDNELAKLALQNPGGRIGPEQVMSSASFQREQEMWDMTNAISAGRVPEAVKRWRRLVQLDPSAEFRAVTWLTIWLEKARKALALRRKGLPAPAAAQQLKIWPRELAADFFRTAETLGESGVMRAFDLLADIDRQSKSGVGDMAANVERFLLTVMIRR